MTTLEIDPSKLYWASFNRFEIRLPGQCVIDCSHSGQCDEDVESWVERIKAQIESDSFLLKPLPNLIRAELKEYGAWSADELTNDEQNFRRLIWIAAGNISDDDAPDCSEPVK
jgi:hypothetical protein